MGDSVFWGVVVHPGKPSAYVPPPEDARLHISQAVLDPAAEDGARVWLRCKVQDGPSLAVAALRCGGAEAQALDLILDQYSELTVEGSAPVHVTGYFIPVEEYDEDHDHEHDDEDEDDDEEHDALVQQFGLPRGMTLDQMRQMYADGDLDLDDEDDDEEDDEDDEDGVPPMYHPGAAVMDEFDDEDDDEEDEETSDYDSEPEAGGLTKSEVVIEELDPQPPEEVAKAAGQKRKADLAAMEPKSAKRPAAQAKLDVKADTAKPKNGQHASIGKGAAGAAAMEEDEDDEDDEDDEEDEDDADDDEEDNDEEDDDEAMPQEQQQRTRQQAKQKPPSIAKALDDAAAAALAGGKNQQQQPQQQKQQQQAAQKKGKKAAQLSEANGLNTPETTTAGATAKTPASGGRKSVRRFENGFAIEDVAIGQPDGKLAKGGKRVQMKYVGRLASNGKVFDQTRGSKPFTFRLGVGEVIKGWDRGIEGMRVGDKRKLTIPPSMGYGSTGAPPDIPPNAKLVFDVELVNVL